MKRKEKRHHLYLSISIFLLAIACIVGATYAWFTLSANTRVNSMNMEITTGFQLRMDTIPHEDIEDYYQKLDGVKIQEASGNEQLDPVTSRDGVNFYSEQGQAVIDSKLAYLEVPLHFKAAKSMYVHLSKNTLDGEEGTNVGGDNGIEQALRLSFSVDGITKIYEPYGKSEGTFTFLGQSQMEYTEENTLFYIEEGIDKEVMLRIWIEGTDPQCTDQLRDALYQIRLCFIGTDENNVPYQ